MVVAVKFHEDQYYTNSHYSFIGGIQLHEFNFMEVQFAKLLDFTFFVTKECFGKYWKELTASCGEPEG